MIKFFSRLKRRKGFTLVEMIVVVALIAIIMASVVAFSGPVRSSIRNSEARADAITINEIIGNYFEKNIAYANRVDAFVGINYGDAAITKAYDDFYKGSLSDSSTRIGCIVCRFDKAGASDGNHGSMKIYDLKPGTSGLPALADQYLIYSKDFYRNYSYFVTTDDTDLAQNTNARTKKAYFNMKIESYKFEDGFDLTAEEIKSHYAYVDAKAAGGSPSTDKLDDIGYYKIGTEVVSFALENMKVGEISSIKTNSSGEKQYYSNGAPIWQTRPTTPSATVTRKSDGEDFVILYKVKKYDYS